MAVDERMAAIEFTWCLERPIILQRTYHTCYEVNSKTNNHLAIFGTWNLVFRRHALYHHNYPSINYFGKRI